jgi:protein TonB
MFEQASIDTRGALRSPWALAVSVTGQTLIISAGFLFSLIHTDVIRPPGFLTTLTVPTGRTPTQQQPEQRAAVRPSKLAPGVFTAPSQIPTTIDMSMHEPGIAFTPEAGPDVGISGGIGTPGLFTSLIDTIARPAPPAPRADVAPPKKADVAIPRKPIAVSTGVQAAKLLRQVKPVYPQLARNARISGVVRLIAIIGKDGAIENLQVTAGHPLLTTAAVDAVKQWLYQPTLLNGEPVAVITQIDVNFTLSQ